MCNGAYPTDPGPQYDPVTDDEINADLADLADRFLEEASKLLSETADRINSAYRVQRAIDADTTRLTAFIDAVSLLADSVRDEDLPTEAKELVAGLRAA